MRIDELEEKLEKWIFDIIEEEMFDDEISNFYFVIVSDKTTYHLEFTGNEVFSLGDFDYAPKAGEYFFCKYEENINEFINKINYLLINLFKNKYLIKLFKNKNIYLIKLQEKIINKIRKTP